MNAKFAKKLRKLAKNATIGLPARGLNGKRHKKGKEGEEQHTMQAVNNPRTTRGVYRHYKKLIRQGMALSEIHARVTKGIAQQAGGSRS